MLTRRLRRIAACFAVAGLVFAQLSLAAHACPLQAAVLPLAVAQTPAPTGTPDHSLCAGAPDAPAGASANVCEVHCTDGVTLPASPDLPTVALVALPSPDALEAVSAGRDAAARTPYAGLPGAPPLILQYCRLLN